MPLSDADYAKLLRLNCDHWALRLEFCFVKMELARTANFYPNQPRAPRGNPDGGQWTDGGGGSGTGSGQAQLISSRPRSGGTIRIGGRLVEATPAQQARLAVSNARANFALRQIRELDPQWRPRPSLYENVEGAILANEHIVREAEARLAKLGRQSGPPLPLRDLIAPSGQSVGTRYRSAGDEVGTVSTAEFDHLLAQLMKDAQNILPPSPTFPGQWYGRSDGTIFSVRISDRHGVTIDIVRSNDPLILRPLKVHQK